MYRTAKAAALVVLLLSGVRGPARADFIGLYRDPGGLECEAVIPPFQVIVTYVIHKTSYGSVVMGSRWKIDDASTLFQIGHASPFVEVGEPYNDISIAYGGCLSGSIQIMTLSHMWMGEPLTCGLMEVVGVPDAGGEVLVTDCQFNETLSSGGRFIFNPTPECPCYDPVEASTWGRVKSLYR